MNDTKFTKGPWEIDSDCFHLFITSGENKLASLPGSGPQTLEVLANAKLMKAGPSLYEALEKLTKAYNKICEEGCRGKGGVYADAIDALANARGDKR